MDSNIFLLDELLPLSELREQLGDSFPNLLNQLGVSDIQFELITDSSITGDPSIIPTAEEVNAVEGPNNDPTPPDTSGD
jgi:hypothetical protein